MLVTVANAAWNYCRRLNKEKYIYIYIHIYMHVSILLGCCEIARMNDDLNV